MDKNTVDKQQSERLANAFKVMIYGACSIFIGMFATTITPDKDREILEWLIGIFAASLIMWTLYVVFTKPPIKKTSGE